MRPWTVDLLKIYQIGSPRLVQFRMLLWTVDLRRGLLTWSIRLRGYPWTVDPWRGCCVWNLLESHHTYPVYVVGEADFNTDTTRVAEITGQNSEFHQLVDLPRRVLSTAERPTPKPEAPEVEKPLQQLVRETRSRPTKAVNPMVTSLQKIVGYSPFSTDSAGDSGNLKNSDPPDETGQT